MGLCFQQTMPLSVNPNLAPETVPLAPWMDEREDKRHKSEIPVRSINCERDSPMVTSCLSRIIIVEKNP
ncbi:hypothetical protein J6590_052804 [Homalodisca vitripennis]|nr:hypothetical protein J6590_052804 [Homalodisca vitripennis]